MHSFGPHQRGREGGSHVRATQFLHTIAQACALERLNVLGQNVSPAPSIFIGDSSLDVVEEFTYLGSVISSSLNLYLELNGRIGKASSIMGRLSRRVWENTKLTTNTKIAVYQACVLSTLMCGSECWTLYSKQEQRLNAFHLRCIRRIWVSPGNNTSPTMKSLNGLESPACSSYWQREDFAGLVMLPAWRTEEYQKICCMVNSPLAQDPLVDQLSGIKMSANATSGLAILHLPTLKPWLLTEMFSGQNRTETERATRDEEAAQTNEGSIGYLGRQSLCVPDLQDDLPLADWALQPQSPLQLDHGMTTKAQTQCLPRQKDANI